MRLGKLALLGLFPWLLCQCGSTSGPQPKQAANLVVSVEQQKIALYGKDGKVSKAFPVSTSKFGLSDKPGSYGTPLGLHEVVAKVGHGVRSGTVYKGRQPTGEVIKPNAPGRDPIVSRIMWLRGLEEQNRNAYRRCIYIHGTADEANIGRAVSYGCIRMKSSDVIDLFERVGIGSRVLIVEGRLPKTMHVPQIGPPSSIPSQRPPIFVDPAPNRPGPAPAAPQQTPMPAPTPYETPLILAQNDGTSMSGFRARTMANGTVVYTPQNSGINHSRIILRSKRTATDSLR